MEINEAVKLAQENNNEGYTYLYENTYQKGYYVALKYMKDEDRAIDVLQDAYVRAFKYIGQLDEADKFPAWFARIVATTALNELKKKSPILFSQMEDEAANWRLEQMMPELMTSAGVTEALKASDPMKWVGLMNTLKAQAEETILTELVFS